VGLLSRVTGLIGLPRRLYPFRGSNVDVLLPDERALTVSEEISPNDRMYVANPEVYAQAGFSALRCIRLAMAAAGMEYPRYILDLPCGHGRVMRVLHAAFPYTQLTGCDILPDAVDFCERTFGAHPVIGKEEPAEIAVGGPFDVIWSGSLLTHVDECSWQAFLELFESALAPGGVVVFTAHGRIAVEERLRPRRNPFGMNDRQIEAALSDYEERGFAYSAHLSEVERGGEHHPSSYGHTFASPSWVSEQITKRPGLRMLLYMEGGWGPGRGMWSQDAVACWRPAEDAVI
jgi:SAM-dependent methyltransferase